ncbi:MAG: 50S ribosomal protein L25/general stress protein Ctc [Bacteroidetes bacterium GWA2_32_17]|nr:MAG: 50S ribosomal protein L25/general stress protein Ctc [Bacteroidetes bacterium GWA2_32_17]
MKSIEINAQLRENVGKKASNALRKSGLIPCVLYGTEKNVHFSAEESQFRKLVYTPDVYFAKLNIDGTEHKAILKDIQFHPVSDKILHIDFLNISDEKPITLSVPVRTTGFAIGVQDGGKLDQDMHRINLKGLLKDFVEEVVIDVTELTIGKSIKVSDLKLDKLVAKEFPSKTIASVRITRVVKEAEVAAEETAEGTPEATAEGATAEGAAVAGATAGGATADTAKTAKKPVTDKKK